MDKCILCARYWGIILDSEVDAAWAYVVYSNLGTEERDFMESILSGACIDRILEVGSRRNAAVEFGKAAYPYRQTFFYTCAIFLRYLHGALNGY